MDQEPKEFNYINQKYQLKLLEYVKKMDTILYIPTGSGKTYITTMLIKEKGESLTKSLGEGRKWTFFILHNEFFNGEQVDNLKNHLPWNIGVISSNMNVESWSREQWDTILEKCHIIVITDHIYLNNLQHGFMNMLDANLIIFDDCHYAESPHPYKEILQIFHGMSFENTDRPRILGLTATLINQNTKNIKEELMKLQQTFNTTIITKYLEDVQIFLAHPKELIHLYDEFNLDKELITVVNRMKTFINFEVIYEVLDNNKEAEESKNNYNFEEQKSLSEIVKNIFCDLQGILVDNGVYYTYIATWHFIVEIEKHKKQNHDETSNKKLMLSTVLSELTIIRKMLYDYIIKDSLDIESQTSIFNNTSPKLKELMTILSRLERNENCLVYVNHQTTAKLLYHYIKLYVNVNKQENIACDYITDTKRASMTESKEMMYKKNINNETIKKFNKKVTNILITTDQLEDCIDILNCKYIIRYDTPKLFSSYIQSKDKARNNGSKFVILMSNLVDSESKRVYSEYIKMEEEMNKILVQSKTVDNYDIKEEYVEEVFKTEFAITTLENAIAVINRYCRSLPQDIFTTLCPEWYIIENYNNHKKYKLKLPINSVILTPIDGKLYMSEINAKKSAALNACIELYNAKALDDYMMPIKNINKLAFTDSYWFPHWENEDIEAKKYKKITGSKQMMRLVHIETPSYLFQSYPQVEEPSYLHVIHCVPNYSTLNDPSDEIFDQLLKSNKDFGILTSKKLPPIAEFPIFLHIGEVLVHIKETADIIFLDQEQYKKLDKFHNKLFVDILKVKQFISRSYINEDNSYMIVPVYYSDNTYSVDWEVVDINNLVESEVMPTMEQRKSKHYEPYLNKHNIISPWYRPIIPIQQYVVTDVYSNMTPQSRFPSDDFNSYETYFNDKYDLNVTVKDQPLIKAKSLNVTKINYLVPMTTNTKQLRRQSKFVEILIPEFCTWHKFPSDYWFKSLMLPTILYRCNQLLLAEELLVKYNSECNIKIFRDSNINDALEMDRFSGFNRPKEKKIILPLCETLSYLKNSQLNNYNELNSNNLPIDIDKQYTTKLLDIFNYHTFMIPINQSKSNHVEKENILKNVLTELNILNLPTGEPPILSPLYSQQLNKKIGPKQSDILKVITSSFLGDIFNNERLNIFGDSFLRFAISLVLFDAYQSENEGFLKELRMKISGYQNLFFVGKNKNLGSYLMGNVFEPIMDWTAPCFNIPPVLKETIEADESRAEVLHNIIIPKNEQYSGKLSDDTLAHIDSEIEKLRLYKEMETSNNAYDDNDFFDDECLQISYALNNLHLNKQSVTDKMVVNCVKSLIGVYGYYCGVNDGFNVLCYFGIIPKELIGAFNKPKLNISDESTPTLNYSNILPGYEILEQRINYSFKNTFLLVQALTHPSYQFENSKCYQRLQFLGDVILDFLITSYIFEHCNDKTVKDIKDIIYSLVNNITFASLSIRIGLHRFILAKSIEITEAIYRFYKYQQRNNHKIGQDVLFLIEENDCETAEYVDVPKVLSDLFSSLIGAIYLDCDRDLNFIWTICYRFLENEIKEFCTHIPKNPIRILRETQLNPKFSNPVASSRDFGIIISLNITLNNKIITVRGCGKNKKAAKLAASKIALRILKKDVLS